MLKYFFLILLFILIASQQKLAPPAHLSMSNCHPDHPYESVGDFIITDNNYTSFISSHNFIMVIGSAGWCKACCKHEEFFYNLKHRYLMNKNINPYVYFKWNDWPFKSFFYFKADEMKIARLDFSIQESSEINAQFKLLRIPYIIFFM